MEEVHPHKNKVLGYLVDSTLTVAKGSFVSQESLLLGDAPTGDGLPAFDSGDFSGPGEISDRLIGHDVAVRGSLIGTEVQADWIIVIE